ncbi:hypothetical protein M9435_002794 [Picochlorum sp. BPE23]|nr:hypothetical protein M9435_002794 [Picochlorum sp. BPE23]
MTCVVGLVVGLLLVQAVPFVFSQTATSPNVKFDPCTPYDQLPVNQGDDYVIGFAYWPGGVWEDWNLTLPGDTRGIPTLNPCLGEVFYNATGFNESTELSQDNIAAFTSGKVGDYNKILSDNNVVFASFTAETDIMASFSIPASEQRKLLDAAQGSSVLTVTAFRGNISSPPMFISSKSPELTKGSGIVKRIGLTIGLDKGILVPGGLQWFMFDGCATCGSNATCIEYSLPTSYRTYSQESCADPFPCDSVNCTTTFIAAFQGNSKSGQPLQSSYQLTSAYQFSITNVFSDVLSGIDDNLVEA